MNQIAGAEALRELPIPMTVETGTILSPHDARFEGYARGLFELINSLGKHDGHVKSYDPMTVSEDGTIMHSYLFDMLDGGRHHKVADYRGRDHIYEVLLADVIRWMNDAGA
jgi:hypothetical protein